MKAHDVYKSIRKKMPRPSVALGEVKGKKGYKKNEKHKKNLDLSF